MLRVYAPYPPSTNRLWRSVKGRNIKSAEYRAWEERCRRETSVFIEGPCGRPDGAYRLTIEAQRPDKRRRDIGNLEKPLSDLLVSIGIVKDDCLAEEITLRWVTDNLAGRVRMTVTPA